MTGENKTLNQHPLLKNQPDAFDVVQTLSAESNVDLLPGLIQLAFYGF